MVKRSVIFLLMILLGAVLSANALAQTALTPAQLEERLVAQVEALLQDGVQAGEHLALGRTYLELGDTFYALPEFIAEYNQDPEGLEAQSAAKEISDILMGMGSILLAQGAPERALVFFDAAEKWLPWYGIDQLRGGAYFMMGDYARSAEMYERARSRSPRPEGIILREVEVCLKAGEVEQARQVLRSAPDPEAGMIRLAQARVILAGGSAEGALAAYELLSDEVKSLGEAVLLQASALILQGDSAAGLRLLEARPAEDFSERSALDAAQILYDQAGSEAAIRFLERRISRQRNTPHPLEKLKLSEWLLEKNQPRRLLEILVPDGRPHPARFYALRAQALELLGQEHSAEREWARLRSLP